MATIADLQKLVNNYANDPDIGFSPIACDGAVGPATLSATIMALTIVNLSGPGFYVDPAFTESAGVLIATLQAPSDLASNIDSVMAVLQGGIGLIPDVGPIPCPTAAQIAASTHTAPPASAHAPAVNPPQAVTPTTSQGAQVLQQHAARTNNYTGGFWGGLPSWAIYAGGGGLLVLIGWAILRSKPYARGA